MPWIGRRYGGWTLQSLPYSDPPGTRVVVVRCDCGVVLVRHWQNIRRGLSRSCGCTRRTRATSTGEVFGDWTVIAQCVDPRYVRCRCACGTVAMLYRYSLLMGDSRSCGHPKKAGDLYVDGTVATRCQANNGRARAKLRAVFDGMIERCHVRGTRGYKDYGGRGIKVCEEWRNEPEKFIEWALVAGYVVGAGLQIDRIDFDGHYEPANCRWVNAKTNARNKRNTVRVTAWGETKPLMDWLDDPRCLVSESTLRSRVERGWSGEEAMTLNRYSRKPVR